MMTKAKTFMSQNLKSSGSNVTINNLIATNHSQILRVNSQSRYQIYICLRGGSRIPRRRGRQWKTPTYRFSQKLHEIKKKKFRWRGAPGAPTLGSATVQFTRFKSRSPLHCPVFSKFSLVQRQKELVSSP